MMSPLPPMLFRQTRAFALVAVLLFLVLLLVLAIGLLTLSRNETRSTADYSAGIAADQLIKQAADIVRAQIWDATTEGDSANPVSWTSQPGLLRTFRGSSPSKIYKLYSWARMRENGTGFARDVIPAGWAALPAIFVDLNEPVAGSYPILDPTGLGGADAPQGLSVGPGAPTQGTSNPAPMPVQWIYVLKDGSLTEATGSGTAPTVPGADRANKEIVGRIAFWTDDETCKVNINTASEGLYWDVPRASGGKEFDRGRFQPVRFEAQCFPGHPSGVCLSEVFPGSNFDLADSGGEALFGNAMRDPATRLAALAPRLQFGGSLAGYADPTNPQLNKDPIVLNAADLAGTRRIEAPDADRLYTSVDEFLFSPARDTQETALAASNAPDAAASIRRRDFTLTVASSSPETTLFDTPRVSLWPIRASANLNAIPSLTNRADAYDKMIALASSLPAGGGNRHRFYFQRENAMSSNEIAGIPRNEQLFGYLQNLTNTPWPGFSFSLASSLGGASNRDSLLVQTFDMIRSQVNLVEGGLLSYGGNQYQSFGYPVNLTGLPFKQPVTPAGHVQPTRFANHRGFGRIPFFNRIGVAIYCEKMEVDAPNGRLIYTVKPAILVENQIPAIAGWGPGKEFAISVRVNNADGFALTPTSAGASGGSAGWASTLPGRTETRSVQHITPNGLRVTNLEHPMLYLVDQTSSSVFSNPPGGGLWGPEISLSFPLPNKADGTPIANADELDLEIREGRAPGWGHNVVLAAGSLDLSLIDSSGSEYHRAAVDFDATPNLTAPYINTDKIRERPPPPPDKPPPPPVLIKSPTTLTSTYTMRVNDTGGLLQWASVLMSSDLAVGKEVRSGSPFLGDWRLAALRNLSPSDFEYPPSMGADQMRRQSFAMAQDAPGTDYRGQSPRLIAGEDMPAINYSGTTQKEFSYSTTSLLSSGVNGVGGAGDYAMDVSSKSIGATIVTPSEGGVGQNSGVTGYRDSFFNEWFKGSGGAEGDLTQGLNDTEQVDLTWSPNRQVYSPIQMTGGLLRRASTEQPWETLLYSANPSSSVHPGLGTDHLFADLFWMPIVDPYPLSEPYATAGKVNLNMTLEPFGGYITRETAQRAALKAIGIPVVDGSQLLTYNGPLGGVQPRKYATPGGSYNPAWPGKRTGSDFLSTGWMQALNLDQTLEGIRGFLSANGVFRSATQICEVPLVPDDTTLASYDSFWSTAARRHTPDNLREEPYAHAYARLTTRSNAYTIHFRVQLLKKVPGTPDDQWVEGRDTILAEHRGSSLIERHLDPNANYPDYATATNPTLLSKFYRWRTLRQTRFAP